MKAFLLIIVISVGISAIAQNSLSVKQSISNNGKTLSIKVNGNFKGKPVDYDNTFNISDLSKTEREALRDKILDSLGINDINVQTSSNNQVSWQTMELKNGDGKPVITSNSKDEQSYIVAGTHPYTKEIKYNSDSGLLFMRYRFTKNGAENIFENLITVKNKTAEEREGNIKSYEKEIGLPLNK